MAYVLTRKNPIVTETKTGSILTFNSALPVVADDVSSLITGYQEGSGTPSPDNVRNLVSFDECIIAKSGKNLFNNNGYFPDTRTINYYYESYVANNNTIPAVLLKAGVTYTFSIDINSSVEPFNISLGVGFGNYALDIATMNNVSNGRISITFTPTEAQLTRGNILAFRMPRFSTVTSCTYTLSNVQLEFGDTPTTYEPYKGNTYTLSFGQSIYEGTIDFTTGVLTATWGYIASYNSETLSGEWISDRDEYVAGNSPTTGAEVAYELATPLEIQLTPTEISLLQGTNNMWSSTGNLTVQFKNVK